VQEPTTVSIVARLFVLATYNYGGLAEGAGGFKDLLAHELGEVIEIARYRMIAGTDCLGIRNDEMSSGGE
jgi:hypothetical protein